MEYKFITSDQDLAAACNTLAGEHLIGVDLEADSMHSFTEKICLIQVAGSDMAYLIDPFEITDFSSFSALLADPAIIKVLHGSDFDVRSLDRELSVEIANLFDTEIACRFLNVKERGLGALLKAFFDVDVDKRFQKVDWSRRPLKEDMIEYSVGDVAHLSDLYDRLLDALEKIGRYAWAKEEFEHQAKVKYEPNHQLPLFKRFKGAGKLDNRTLAVLEALLQVRLEMAEKKDLPLFKIISNQSIMAMATAKPSSVKKMIETRALSKKQAGMYGEACCDAIEKARALPHGELPSYPKTRMPRKTPKVLERITRLKQMRERLSESIGMEPGFLINNNMISTLAFDDPKTVEALGQIEAMRNWQIEALGDDILNVLSSCR